MYSHYEASLRILTSAFNIFTNTTQSRGLAGAVYCSQLWKSNSCNTWPSNFFLWNSCCRCIESFAVLSHSHAYCIAAHSKHICVFFHVNSFTIFMYFLFPGSSNCVQSMWRELVNKLVSCSSNWCSNNSVWGLSRSISVHCTTRCCQTFSKG